MADSQRKTANLFDEVYPDISGTVQYRALNLGNGTYTLSSTVEISQGSAGVLFLLAGNVSSGASTATNAVYKDRPITVTAIDGYVTIAYRTYTTDTPVGKETMLNEGSTPLPYEPYGWLHSLRKLGTSTDTITTLPADIYANDTTVTVGLKGDMEQSGTPTSTTPIQPQECGEKTGNLFDYKIAYTSYLQQDGTIIGTAQQLAVISNSLANFVGQTVTISIYCINVSATRLQIMARENGVAVYSNNITRGNSGYLTLSVTPELSTDYWAITYGSTGTNETLSKFMLNEGSTAKPFEPYGIKIPISSANTTTNVYLSEVETTRKIKKLVLTGGETWQEYQSTNAMRYNLSPIISDGVPLSTLICSHLSFGGYTATDGYAGEITGTSSTTLFRIYFWSDINTVTAWKAYLAQQYANGTPVCVWYVLATDETGIVNEPLRKIGDYVDTVSGITIPTITGKDSFDVLTTLKPSEVSLAYTGWHDASVKEYVGGVKANQLQSAAAGTYTNNGITVTCDGQGRYHISGTNTENASFTIPIPEVSFTTNVNVGLFNNVVTQKVVIGFMDDDVSLSGWYINSENRVINNQYSLKNTPINVLSISVQPTTIECDVSPYINVSSVEVPDHYIPYGGQWE